MKAMAHGSMEIPYARQLPSWPWQAVAEGQSENGPISFLTPPELMTSQ
jgi:hypothetical protein